MKKMFFLIIMILLFPMIVRGQENVSIENIELLEVNNAEIINDLSYEGLDLRTDIKFFDVGDSVTYKVTLKNNDNRNYSIADISSESRLDFFSLESDSKGKVLYAGKAEDVLITVKYVKHITNDITLLSNNTYQETGNISMSFVLEEYNDIINPETGKNIFLLILVSCLILIFRKSIIKRKAIFLMILLALFSKINVVIASERITVDFNLNLNALVKINFLDRNWKDVETDSFTKIEFIQIDADREDAFDISEEKDRSIIEWVEDDTLYIGSYHNVYAPVNSSYLFAGSGITTAQSNSLKSITGITFNDRFMTNYVGNLNNAFRGTASRALTVNLNLNSWNTENVTDMSYMFYDTGYSSSSVIIDFNKLDTSKVTTMYYMFYNAGYNAKKFNVDASNWDISNLENMSKLFSFAGYSATDWSIGDLSNWNTAKVKNMMGAFESAGYSVGDWNIGNLSNWDTSNVTNMSAMFSRAGYNATKFNLDLSHWNTSKVFSIGNMSSMFSKAGYNATSFSILINNTNGVDINNETDKLYGKTTSCYTIPPEGITNREFTLASI